MKINIGALGRWVLRQTLGSQRGQEVIDALESGLWDAMEALRQKDFKRFWVSLPREWQDWLITQLSQRLGVHLPAEMIRALIEGDIPKG